MPLSVERCKQFVYEHGTLWERALFAHLFERRPVDRLHQCLLCYRNDDGGYGHGLECDISCPDSNPLQVEFLLRVLSDFRLPPGSLLDGTVGWLERQREPNGELRNSPALADYPMAPWWNEMGGQRTPDSITGNLLRLGMCSPTLADSTRAW